MAKAKKDGEKKYTIAGTSVLDGIRGFRFANGKLNVRVNMLNFKEHTKINLIELPRPMTKVNAMAFLMKEHNMTGTLPTRANDKKAKNPLVIQAQVRAGILSKEAGKEALAALG